MRTILLPFLSNIFMTFAWYGHLRFRSEALWKVILASWGIAFFEYCFQVPANRIRLVRIHACATKDDSRDHHAFHFSGVFDFLSRGPLQVELRRGLCPDCGGSVLYFPQMVD